MPHYVVSACLAGHICRYDGQSHPCPAVLRLVEQGLALPLCPEVLGGLPVPRIPCEIRDNRVLDKEGQDRTQAFARGAALALSKAREKGCREAILKSRSPSCGPSTVYDGSFSGCLIAGQGLWARLLTEAGFTLYSEEQLPDPPAEQLLLW